MNFDVAGTYVYMAPEVIRCEPYTEKSDIYSFGIILNELITGKYPYIEIDYSPFRVLYIYTLICYIYPSFYCFSSGPILKHQFNLQQFFLV